MFFSEKAKNRISRDDIVKYGEWLLITISPILLLIIQSILAGRNLFLGVPVWSDELDYYREMFSFSQNGFGFGGSMYVGMEAQIGPMGAHSFSPIAAWGLFFWLFKNNHAILWANIIIYSLAWLICVTLLKPDKKVGIYLLVLAYLYPPVILYIHSSMIELVCFAGMIIYFSLLHKWVESNNNSFFYCLLLVGIWCIAVRPTYVVILFPVIWRKCKFRFNFRTLFAMVKYILLFGVYYKIYGLFCANYPGWLTYKMEQLPTVKAKLLLMVSNSKENIVRLINPKSADLAQVSLRYYYIIVLIVIIVSVVMLAYKKKSEESEMIKLSLFIMAGALLAVMVVMYDIKDFRDYRTFSPIIMGITLYLFIEKDSLFDKQIIMVLLGIMIVSHLLSGINFVREKQEPAFADMSEMFSVLETEDYDGKPLTIGVDPKLNWCDISVMNSVPAKLGFEVFLGEYNEEMRGLVDYVFLSYDFVDVHEDVMENYEVILEVPQYGKIYKER